MTNWKLSWNHKSGHHDHVMKHFLMNPEHYMFEQAKGNAKMVRVPEPGDIVYVSCCKKKIMKCLVCSPFHINSMGFESNVLKPLEIYEKPEDFPANRRNWICLDK